MTGRTAALTAERVSRALGKNADTVTRCGPSRWNLALTNGEVLRSRAWLSEDWLHMEAGVRHVRRKARASGDWLWNCLVLNGMLPGCAKYAVDARNRLRIRCEVPLASDADDIDLCRRVRWVCDGLKAASEAVHEWTAGKHDALRQEALSYDGSDAHCDLERLCEESGWPFTRRAAARLAVELDVRDVFHQAIIEPRPDGIRASVGLLSDAMPSAVSRRAIGALLLTFGAVLRMARGAGAIQDGHATTWLEVPLPPCPLPAELAHALCALSVGCGLCAREVEALKDDVTAREYLTVRGWSV